MITRGIDVLNMRWPRRRLARGGGHETLGAADGRIGSSRCKEQPTAWVNVESGQVANGLSILFITTLKLVLLSFHGATSNEIGSTHLSRCQR